MSSLHKTNPRRVTTSNFNTSLGTDSIVTPRDDLMEFLRTTSDKLASVSV